MRVDEAKLVAAVADRLNEALPADVRVEHADLSLTTYGPDGMYAVYRTDDLLPTEKDEAHEDFLRDPWPSIEYWVYRVLDGVQDDVAHATRSAAWPPSDSPSEPLPMPWAERRMESLHLGYGGFALSPMPVADIQRFG